MARLRTLFIWLLVSLTLLGLVSTSLAEGESQAAVVVVFADDNFATRCVTFDGEASGVALLRDAGFRVVGEASAGIGEAVCKIDDFGCDYPGEQCFCQCLGSECDYWSYWYWEDEVWVYSGMGGSNRMVSDGGIEGWVWGDGQQAPPEIAFGDICQLEQPTETMVPTDTTLPTEPSTETPTVTTAPTETSTATQAPTETSLPTDTSVPTETQTETLTPTVQPETETPTPTWTSEPTLTPTLTPTSTPALSSTPTPTSTPSATATVTPEGAPTATASATPSRTVSPTRTVTGTQTSTPTRTRTRTPTRTRTATLGTPEPSKTNQYAYPGVTLTPTRTRTRTRTPTRTRTLAASLTPRPSWTPANKVVAPSPTVTLQVGLEPYPAPPTMQGRGVATKPEIAAQSEPRTESDAELDDDGAIQSKPQTHGAAPQPMAPRTVVATVAPTAESVAESAPGTKPTNDAVALMLRTAVAKGQATPTPLPKTERVAQRDYGALLALILGLMLVIGYATAVRAQQRGKAR